MKKEDIHLGDWYRILNGPVPPVFYIELIIRALFVYALINFGMKYMGKRISADLTRTEVASIASLAAATGLAIMAPERGLLPPVIVLIVMLSLKWLMDKLNYRNEHFEYLTEGKIGTLVKDGVLQLDEMKKTRISKEQLYAHLRGSGIAQLGAVKRLFMEANGSFTLVEEEKPQPGLAVMPDWDKEFLEELTVVNTSTVCGHCGHTRRDNEKNCRHCGANQWQYPVIA